MRFEALPGRVWTVRTLSPPHSLPADAHGLILQGCSYARGECWQQRCAGWSEAQGEVWRRLPCALVQLASSNTRPVCLPPHCRPTLSRQVLERARERAERCLSRRSERRQSLCDGSSLFQLDNALYSRLLFIDSGLLSLELMQFLRRAFRHRATMPESRTRNTVASRWWPGCLLLKIVSTASPPSLSISRRGV